MSEEEQEACSRNAQFVVLSEKMDRNTSAAKKYWIKDVRPAWGRIASLKPKESDEALRDLVFAMKHRVCGSGEMVDLYLKGSDDPQDELLTFDNFKDKTHPDLTKEKEMMDESLMRLKPFFTLEELCYLAKHLHMFKRNVSKKKAQGGSKAGSSRAPSSKSESPTVARLLKKLDEIDTETHALNVVKYNIEKGVGLKTVAIPQLHGAVIRYMIQPIPIVAADADVYAHILDMMYPDATATKAELDAKSKHKVVMKYLLAIHDKSRSPTQDLESVLKSMETLESQVQMEEGESDKDHVDGEGEGDEDQEGDASRAVPSDSMDACESVAIPTVTDAHVEVPQEEPDEDPEVDVVAEPEKVPPKKAAAKPARQRSAVKSQSKQPAKTSRKQQVKVSKKQCRAEESEAVPQSCGVKRKSSSQNPEAKRRKVQSCTKPPAKRGSKTQSAKNAKPPSNTQLDRIVSNAVVDTTVNSDMEDSSDCTPLHSFDSDKSSNPVATKVVSVKQTDKVKRGKVAPKPAAKIPYNQALSDDTDSDSEDDDTHPKQLTDTFNRIQKTIASTMDRSFGISEDCTRPPGALKHLQIPGLSNDDDYSDLDC